MITRSMLILAIALGLTACASTKFINPDYQLVLENEADEEAYRRRLEDWFNCDECVSGQLRRVQEYGNTAVADLADARNGNMIEVGGIELGLADSDQVLQDRCTRIAHDEPILAGVTEAALSVDDCIARFQANRERRYKGRASIALLAIRTKDACDALGDDAEGKPVCKVIPPFLQIEDPPSTSRSVRAITH